MNAATIMLSIVWTDRRAVADDCTCSLADFLQANADSGPWPEVEALKVGESVQLDWTTVTRIEDGAAPVPALTDEEMRAAESRRLDNEKARAANELVNRVLSDFHRRWQR